MDTTPKYIGYCERLPLLRGQEVTIPKGTRVHSTHPHRGDYVTARAMKVRVHHIMSGCTVTVGVVHQTPGGTRFQWRVTDSELRGIAEHLGLSMSPDDCNKIQFYARRNLVATETPDRFLAVIHKANPRVVWAGTGGYWCEVDINLVPEALAVDLVERPHPPA